MCTVTFDSTERPNSPAVELATTNGWNVAYASVTRREAAGTDFEVILKTHDQIPELGAWNESTWNTARFATKHDAAKLEDILSIISNHSFPLDRSALSKGQLHQLRDAMILEAHAAAQRDIFVTSDKKGFMNNTRREQLQNLLNTRMMTPDEFIGEFGAYPTDA